MNEAHRLPRGLDQLHLKSRAGFLVLIQIHPLGPCVVSEKIRLKVTLEKSWNQSTIMAFFAVLPWTGFELCSSFFLCSMVSSFPLFFSSRGHATLLDAQPLERVSIYEATLSQAHTLCVLSAPHPPTYEEAATRARLFWYIYTQEGINTGIRGNRFVL